MMHCSKADLPAVFEAPQGMWRMTEWESMNIEYMAFQQGVDPGPLLLHGLPDSLCSCPHWGYVIQGQVRILFADHEEIYNAGDVCYIAPGHRPVFGANTEFVAFSLLSPIAPSWKWSGRISLRCSGQKCEAPRGLGSLRRDRRLFIANEVALLSPEPILGYHRRWRGKGQWVLRALRAFDSTRAEQLAIALEAFY